MHSSSPPFVLHALGEEYENKLVMKDHKKPQTWMGNYHYIPQNLFRASIIFQYLKKVSA
jgi:hypothetical protein